MDTQLTVTNGASTLTTFDPLDLIEQSSRAESTKRKYVLALQPYLDAGGNLADPDRLREYADGLSVARRRHLSSAVHLWTNATQTLLRAHVTPDTIGQTQAALMRLEAIQEIVKTPAAKGQKAHTWLSPKQVKELMNTCGDDLVGERDRVVLALLVGAGLRRDELSRLTWECVKWQPCDGKMRTVLEIHGKGAKDRVVPISDRLATIVDQWSFTTGPAGRIVRSLGMAQELGDSLSGVGIFQVVRAHGAMIGLPELAAHDLRRSYAQIGYDGGVTLPQLAKLLGHADIKTTIRYLNRDLDLSVTASDFVPL